MHQKKITYTGFSVRHIPLENINIPSSSNLHPRDIWSMSQGLDSDFVVIFDFLGLLPVVDSDSQI